MNKLKTAVFQDHVKSLLNIEMNGVGHLIKNRIANYDLIMTAFIT